MDDTMVITLFRHGMTEENKRHAYLGWNDSPLCHEEKTKLKQYDLKGNVIFSSDLGRCMETTKLLFPQKRPELISEFREMNFGKWEGKTYIELVNNPLYAKWLADFSSVHPPEGEAFQDFCQRVDRGWMRVKDRLMVLQENHAIIVTHGGVINYLLMKYGPVPMDFWQWKVPHGGGYQLVWQKEDWRSGERCTLLREVPLMENQDGSESITI